MNNWKNGILEEWKDGRMEDWNDGIMERWKTDEVIKSQQNDGCRKKLQLQGAQELRSEAYLHVRCNDEVEAQSRSERDRWTFYETIKLNDGCRERGVENGYFESDPKAGKRKGPRV